jgi:hypothetical protein
MPDSVGSPPTSIWSPAFVMGLLTWKELATRLARAIGVVPLEFFVAAGICTYEEPLFAVEDAWDYVLACVIKRLAVYASPPVCHSHCLSTSAR